MSRNTEQDAPTQDAHRDDRCIEYLAGLMREKMRFSREEKGRSGWQDMPADVLSKMLREHVDKGDPVDVANFCMMLAAKRSPIEKAMGVEEPRADGEEVVYQVQLKGGLSGWQDVDFGHYQTRDKYNWLKRTLYTCPANVAALEARVKELEAENAALKSKSSDPDDVTCALMDSQYVAGAKFGWNCGQDDDHDSLTKMIEGRLRDRIEAGVSFSKRSKDARAALTREGGV